MTIVKNFIGMPIYKVIFGLFSVFFIVLLSPILALAIAYVLFGDSRYLEYINPNTNGLFEEEEGDQD